MIKYTIWIILLIVILAAGAIIYYQLRPSESDLEVNPGEIASVETMAQLCAIDIYSEVPVLDTINDKVIFAIQKQRGSVTFDLDNMEIDTGGDTIRVTLPKERIDLYESTDPDSWEVIDTKAIGPLALIRSDKFTLEEENAVKSRIRRKSIDYLYDNGTIRRARSEAADNIRSFLSRIYGRPAVVTDTIPMRR